MIQNKGDIVITNFKIYEQDPSYAVHMYDFCRMW